ncbi:MAG: hypothetical protein FD152_2284 [Xanthobacteraceae bacterium]|nr:MAG: hypothetical protein FD152_2284 [Xanthobacteraceae bacterium]
MGIEPADGAGRALGLEHVDILGAVDDLALQVGERHAVVVDDADGADAGGGEVEEQRRTESAGADHQDPRRLQLLLAGPSHLAQDDVAGVSLEFLG